MRVTKVGVGQNPVGALLQPAILGQGVLGLRTNIIINRAKVEIGAGL